MSSTHTEETDNNKTAQTLWSKDFVYVEELGKEMCSNEVLMEWILVPENFRLYRGLCKPGETKKKRSEVMVKILAHFERRGFYHRTTRTINARLGNLFQQYKKYRYGLLNQDVSLEGEAGSKFKERICPSFDEFDTLMRDSATTAFVAEDTDNNTETTRELPTPSPQISNLEEEDDEIVRSPTPAVQPRSPKKRRNGSIMERYGDILKEDSKKIMIMENEFLLKQKIFEKDLERDLMREIREDEEKDIRKRKEKRLNDKAQFEKKTVIMDKEMQAAKLMYELGTVSKEEFNAMIRESLEKLKK